MLVSKYCLMGSSYHRDRGRRARECSLMGWLDYASRMKNSAPQSPWWWVDIYVSTLYRYARSFMDRG